jgi:hypothetical protein
VLKDMKGVGESEQEHGHDDLVGVGSKRSKLVRKCETVNLDRSTYSPGRVTSNKRYLAYRGQTWRTVRVSLSRTRVTCRRAAGS